MINTPLSFARVPWLSLWERQDVSSLKTKTVQDNTLHGFILLFKPDKYTK